MVCFRPEPHGTRGEARAIGELADACGWDRLMVVIDRHHLRRGGVLVAQCAPDTQIDVVAASDALPPDDRVVHETVALAAAVTVHRAY